MDASSIVLGGGQRKRLMALYRGKEAHPQAQVRLRAHIILLPADGHAWTGRRTKATVVLCPPGRVQERGQGPGDGVQQAGAFGLAGELIGPHVA